VSGTSGEGEKEEIEVVDRGAISCACLFHGVSIVLSILATWGAFRCGYTGNNKGDDKIIEIGK